MPRPSLRVISAGLAAGALVVAVSGASYAAGKIDGSSIKKRSIPGNRLEPNALTGKQVDESTLKKVPRAAVADTAGSAQSATSAETVNGHHVSSFSITLADNGATQMVDVPGGTLSANCPDGATRLDLVGTTDTGEYAVISGYDASVGGFEIDSQLKTSPAIGVSPNNSTAGNGVLSMMFGTGSVATVDFVYFEGGGNTCIYAGTVVSNS